MGNVIWQGDGVDIPQINTVTLGGGPWVAGETITLTISDKLLILTIGTAVDAPTVLDNLVIMVSGSGTFGAGYSANALGNTIGEFAEITATEDGATVLTLTANTSGKPFILTSATDSTLGTVADATPTANSSKNDWNNTQNWDTGVVPVAADDVLFENGEVDVLYGLNQSAIAHASITWRQTYTGNVGLPEVDSTGTVSYSEYRGTFLQTGSAVLLSDSGDGIGSGRIKVDSGATSPVAGTIRATGSALDTDLGAFIWKGTGANVDWTIDDGDVGFGVLALDLATIDVLTVQDGIVRQVNGTIDDFTCNGDAEVDIRGNIATTFLVRGGNITARGTLPTGAVVGLEVQGGTVNLAQRVATSVQNIIIFGEGAVDATLAEGVITATNAEMYAGASLLDPNEQIVFSTGIDLKGASLEEVTIDVGRDRTVTPS